MHEPQDEKKKHFTKMHVDAYKNVERTFGVLKAQRQIVKNLCRHWELKTINNIMICCIIMHNMIIQDKVGHEFEHIFYEAIRNKGLWKIFSFHELNVGTQKLKKHAYTFCIAI